MGVGYKAYPLFGTDHLRRLLLTPEILGIITYFPQKLNPHSISGEDTQTLSTGVFLCLSS